MDITILLLVGESVGGKEEDGPARRTPSPSSGVDGRGIEVAIPPGREGGRGEGGREGGEGGREEGGEGEG